MYGWQRLVCLCGAELLAFHNLLSANTRDVVLLAIGCKLAVRFARLWAECLADYFTNVKRTHLLDLQLSLWVL